MQLGKALVGAIIGAAVGVAILVAVYLLFGVDRVWLAVGVALLTGLGVRMMVSTAGHASYARGAMTGVIALLAYVGGWMLVAELATRRAASPAQPIQIAAAEERADEAAESEDTEAPAAAPPQPEAPPVERPGEMAARRAVAPRAFSPWDFVWLSLAALIAYELGRGTGMPAATATTTGETTADPAISREGGGASGTPPEVVRPPD